MFLDRTRPGGCTPAGLFIAGGVLRLWDDLNPEEWCAPTRLISRDANAWLRDDVSRVFLIYPTDPEYDLWWAWYCACELGAVSAPPMEGRT